MFSRCCGELKVLYYRIPAKESLFERPPYPVDTKTPLANQYCDCAQRALDEIVPCGKTTDSKTYKVIDKDTVAVPTGMIGNNVFQAGKRRRRETEQDYGGILVNYNYDPSSFDQAIDSKNNLDINWPTSTGITEDEAREYCNKGILESPVYLACANYTNNVEDIIAKCMSDVQVVLKIFIKFRANL